jgi:hypothetical protein
MYQQLLDRKTSWKPAEMEYEPISEDYGRLVTLQKAIALGLALELPVGDFTLSASKGDLPTEQGVVDLLIANSADEDTHYAGFLSAERAFGCPEKFKQEANQLAELVINHPDHVVTKSGYLELGVFFVTLPMMRKLGSVGLKLLSENISRDEAIHVSTNFLIIDQLGLKISQSLDKLRIDVVEWVTSELTLPGMGRAYWRRQSDKLVANRQAPELAWTKAGQSAAFFEISNKNFGKYST